MSKFTAYFLRLCLRVREAYMVQGTSSYIGVSLFLVILNYSSRVFHTLSEKKIGIVLYFKG